MAREKMKVCPTCGHVNRSENLSCENCYADLGAGGGGGSGPSQLAQLARLNKQVERTNRRLGHLIGSVWLMFALVVVWTVVAAIMGVGGPAALFRWPF